MAIPNLIALKIKTVLEFPSIGRRIVNDATKKDGERELLQRYQVK